MKYAISNIALPAYDHSNELFELRDMGFEGLEVAPSRVWRDTINVSFSAVQSYKRLLENADLKIVGLHSLFFDQPQLGLFRGEKTRRNTLNFLVHLSKVCADLGGRILIFGSPAARRRHDLPVEEADIETIAFFKELSTAVESHGTCFCIEPLRADESDYIHSAMHALRLTQRVNRQELKTHLDAKAICSGDEANLGLFKKVQPTLAHFHANDPGLGILGETGEVDHMLLGRLLKQINYQGCVSMEQKMIDQAEPLKPIKKSFSVLRENYK